MNAYCPDCETELDQASGICPACRWDPYTAAAEAAAAAPAAQQAEHEISLTERYRGSEYDIAVNHLAATQQPTSVSRGRTFVVVSLVAGVLLYGVVIGLMGPAF